jgi:hypothetical protein
MAIRKEGSDKGGTSTNLKVTTPVYPAKKFPDLWKMV